MSLTNKVLIAMVLGIITGLILNITITGLNLNIRIFGLVLNITKWTEWINVDFINNYVINGVFHVVGELFKNGLKMLVVPIILFSLIPGIIGIGDISLLGRVGSKTIILYLITTAIAITISLLFAAGVGVGEGVQATSASNFTGKEASSFSDVLISIIPSNPIAAMTNGDMLAVIFFAIFFGIALLSVTKESPELVKLVEQCNAVIMQMVNMVMHFAPIAVFCLVGKAIAELGFDLLMNLAGYVVVLVCALLFHMLVTQMVFLKTLSGLSIKTFLEKIRTAQLFAFSTSSSAATIPVTLRTVQKRMGVDRSISSFSIPFGATINMDGTAIMQGVATVFVANMYGIELSTTQYLMVIVTAVLASIGTAAVPSVGLVMLTMVFAQVGLPVEGIGIILGIDRLLDMLRTSVNVTGDAVVTSIVAKSENRMDLDVFNDPEAGLLDED